jgi:myo-inositol-1(or 4)-monophosphatase
MDIEKAVSVMSEISCYAGNNIIIPGFNSDTTTIEYKSKTDMVTSIDKETEKYLLKRLEESFSGCDVIAEESGKVETGAEYVWIVDPLDGTNNFAHGIPHFSISIGLYSRKTNQVEAGIVYNPVLNELFSATNGGGAYLNGKKISVSSTEELGIALISTGFAYDKGNSDINNLTQFNGILPLLQGIRRLGSAALDLAYTACGRLDGYWEAMINSWDISAGVLIVEEAGGKVTDYSGNRMNIFEKELIASNGIIHHEFQCAVKENTNCFPNML